MPAIKSILAPEVAAVHADVAHAGFAILRDERRGGANTAAKARLFHWRGQAGDAEVF